MQPLFRGKTPEGKWVYGYYVKIPFPLHTEHRIYLFEQKDCEEEYLVVLPQSVGQWTGFLDASGKQVFDGDILRIKWYDPQGYQSRGDVEIVTVSFEKYHWSCSGGKGKSLYNYTTMPVTIEIIGNTTDTPELSK